MKRLPGCFGITGLDCIRRWPMSAHCGSSRTGLLISPSKPTHDLGYGIRIPGARSMARISMGGVPYLSVDEVRHEITRWDKENLIYQTGSECVDYVYSINRSTQQVTGVRKLKSNIVKGFCGDIQAELKLRLANGFEVYRELETAARPVAVNVTVALLLLAYCLFRIRRIYNEKPNGED